MIITSTAFQHNENIPSEYTCDGANRNPPLAFSQVPEKAKSLVLVVEDPDAPSKVFTHWLLYNISPATLQILESQVPKSTQGMTDFGRIGYGGPCPPPASPEQLQRGESGTHRYFFKLYALDTAVNLLEGASKEEVQEAMKDHIIESAELIGLYERKI